MAVGLVGGIKSREYTLSFLPSDWLAVSSSILFLDFLITRIKQKESLRG